MAIYTDLFSLGYIDPSQGFTILSLGGWLWLGLLGFFGFFFNFLKKFLKRSKKKRLIILLILAVSVIISSVYMIKKQPSQSAKKIVVLGFDGLSPNIVEAMMAEGALPHFSALKKSGGYSRLATTNPPESPVAWSAFATGMNPGKSGIYDFIVRDPKTYGLKLSLSNIENGKAKKVLRSDGFWLSLTSKKFPVTMLSCPITFPPDKIHGRMLSGMGVPDVLGTEGTFTFYTTEDLPEGKDIGGNTIHIERSEEMTLHLIGPKVQSLGGDAESCKAPFTVKLNSEGSGVTIKNHGKEFNLKKGQWSDWQEVSFSVGGLKSMKGIFKYFLVETSPEFKLYISPINFDPRDPYFPISYPKTYSRELADRIGLYYTLGMPMETWGVNENRLSEGAFLEQVRSVQNERILMLEYELGRFKSGLLFCYFEDPDIIQHMFWRYTDPGHPLYEENAPAEYKDMIRTWYQKLDAILGNTLKALRPEDTLVVLSDHGFDTFRRTMHINSWLRQSGFLQLTSADKTDGAELLSDIDWSRTKAYAVGFGGIYLNLKGREKYGIVTPGKEAENLKSELAAALLEWKDEKDGRLAVNNVYKSEDIFHGPFAEEAPDLYVGFKTGYQASWQTALGGTPGKTTEDNLKKWSGSHLFDPKLIPGVLFSNRNIRKQDPSLYDFAPTFLKLAGFSDEEIRRKNFDGEELF